MSLLSVRLSRALERGRAAPTADRSRAELLRVLLRKRAAAHNAGAEELEAMLRDQIRWSLPIQRPVDHGD
ncbi:hypothetical protein [Sphingomonas sp.]|uniref:hypothetical protein n=1 Tax=Sphingomonas sp. TaxID=28214 RepID=UPI002C7C166C|nr:hypothetical protein [Sphingomonas sp.]HWK35964.1 hypothetical protein [Sphingomonas sp.]